MFIGAAAAITGIIASVAIWVVPAPSDPEAVPNSALPPPRHPQPTVRRRPPPIVDFNRFITVEMANYASYESYDRSAVQFTTKTGIRCRIDTVINDEPGPTAIYCWGTPPGMPADINVATVDLTSHVSLTAGTAVFSDFSYSATSDLLNGPELYRDARTFAPQQVDPASYHVLAPGQKIAISRAGIPIGRFGVHRDDPAHVQAICAVDDSAMVCDLQRSGVRHGFVLARTEAFAY